MYNYASNRKLSKKLFIFKDLEDSKYQYFQYKDFRNKPQITESVIIPKSNSINFPKNETIKKENIISNKSQDLIQSRVYSNSNTEINDINPNENKNKKNKTESVSICEVIKVSICCCCKKNFKELLIKQPIDIIEKNLDIFIYIRNMILIDIMYKILIDENNKDHINFLSRILVYKKPEQNEKEEELNDFYKPLGRLNLNKLFMSFYELENKREEIRTETDKKIIKLFNNQFK